MSLRGKKEKGRNPDRRDFETEVSRLAVLFAGSATKDLKPKEMVVSISFRELSFKFAAKMSYRANDICVAKRQKHNGMSWSPNGSAALAVISAVYSNRELSQWLNEQTLTFKMRAKQLYKSNRDSVNQIRNMTQTM